MLVQTVSKRYKNTLLNSYISLSVAICFYSLSVKPEPVTATTTTKWVHCGTQDIKIKEQPELHY